MWAEKWGCPYGGSMENHYETIEEAEVAYERKNEAEYGSFATFSVDSDEDSVTSSEEEGEWYIKADKEKAKEEIVLKNVLSTGGFGIGETSTLVEIGKGKDVENPVIHHSGTKEGAEEWVNRYISGALLDPDDFDSSEIVGKVFEKDDYGYGMYTDVEDFWDAVHDSVTPEALVESDSSDGVAGETESMYTEGNKGKVRALNNRTIEEKVAFVADKGEKLGYEVSTGFADSISVQTSPNSSRYSLGIHNSDPFGEGEWEIRTASFGGLDANSAQEALLGLERAIEMVELLESEGF